MHAHTQPLAHVRPDQALAACEVDGAMPACPLMPFASCTRDVAARTDSGGSLCTCNEEGQLQ